jgi:hypothetical protein
VFGIEDHRLDVEASMFKIASGFFVDLLVFGGDYFPVKVLVKVLTANNDKTVTSAKEGAIYSDYNGLSRFID